MQITNYNDEMITEEDNPDDPPYVPDRTETEAVTTSNDNSYAESSPSHIESNEENGLDVSDPKFDDDAPGHFNQEFNYEEPLHPEPRNPPLNDHEPVDPERPNPELNDYEPLDPERHNPAVVGNGREVQNNNANLRNQLIEREREAHNHENCCGK